MLFNIFILVSIFLVIAFWPSKRVQFNRQFNANDIGRDLEEYLRLSEDREKYIKELDNTSKILTEAIKKIKKVGIKAKSKHFGD